MYVYGGYIAQEATYNVNVYAFDMQKQTWEVYYQGKRGGGQPEGRSDFDVVVEDGCLWMFGGHNGKNNLGDFWKFDLKMKQWTLV